MPNIKVNSLVIENVIADEERIIRQLNDIAEQSKLITARINTIKTSSFGKIKTSLHTVEKHLLLEKNKSLELKNNLSQIVALYDENEKNICNLDSSGGESKINNNPTKEKEENNPFLEILKSIFKWTDKTDEYEKGGIVSSGIEYIESLYKFFTGDLRGLTGAADWLNLGDKSIGVWKEYYDYLNSQFDGQGGIFSFNNQMGVAGLGLLGSMFGFYSSMYGSINTINTAENMGTAGIIGNLLGNGVELTDVGKSFYDLIHVGEDIESGIYTPQSIYAATAKAYISSLSQGFKSYEKYSADGAWDLRDTGATGIEASVAGLGAIVSALTFGLVSDKTTGVSAEQFSESLEKAADDIGTQSGKYIVNDPELKRKYQESNVIGRIAITAYAVFKSW